MTWWILKSDNGVVCGAELVELAKGSHYEGIAQIAVIPPTEVHLECTDPSPLSRPSPNWSTAG